ncbi:uncharacterized protein Z519_07156 [Cladophialophora bantiana CBS 173.52]|uniref:F-box domain-containing protein n=1 Tax=Cladophialophora bantiana (strain ATCC 10958 / CBS 173.52 / CDC B-1940 / NIH 8579) TaxID=1442370 RepID=A0A0D2G0A5_CLAB1|nr:uncharacterized protein Z519_07156 [Cladophialophora bantiana CBS 173.52]KIW92172.1 hypothetical protein Z519_07156 [Cladophialophora bantiana CBS 173.52]
MPRTIMDLPLELLQDALKSIFHFPPDIDGTLLNCMSTCSLWRHIGESTLYSNVTLTGPQLVKFCESPNDAAKWTKSLIVHIQPAYYKHEVVLSDNKMQELRSTMRRLSMMLRFMSNLQTFSFRVSHKEHVPQAIGLVLRRGGLKRILSSLPRSI